MDVVIDLVDQFIEDGETPGSAIDILLNTLLYVTQQEYGHNCIEKLQHFKTIFEFVISSLEEKFKDCSN